MIDHFTLVIGAPKCGTTSLFNYLSEHPEIAPCQVKEPNFYSKQDIWEKGFDWYQHLWDWQPDRHRTALEATPLYTRAEVYRRIAQVNARFKFIYLLRNPIHRIESQYIFNYYRGLIPSPESSGARAGQITESSLQQYINDSRYADKIDQFCQFFPLNQLLILRLEDLQDHPANVLGQICRFLEVDETYPFQTMGRIFNPKESHDPLWQRLRDITLLRSVARHLPDSVKQPLRQLLLHRPVRRRAKPQPLTDSQKEFILHSLHEDLSQLHDRYGIHWSPGKSP